MAAIMFRGLQSCYESHLLDSRASTTLRLTLPCSKTLTPPTPQPMDFTFKSSFCDSNSKTRCPEEISSKTDKGGWSFLQALSNVHHGGLKEPWEKESIYVHPQAKRSSLILSEKSLQLCTENLGNETGTDIVGNSIDLLCSSCSSSEHGSAGDSQTVEQTRAARPVLGGKKTKTQNFPPPLTTIRGSESLRVRPHREEGRLVIEAVRVPLSATCFKAERSHGRLRLRLLENESTSFDSEDGDADEIEEVESEMKEEEVEDEEEEEERDGRIEGLRGYDMPRRCKEGECENNEMLIFESLWVTT
ncbi:protein FANTASTIC FOUR 3-like [Neltuma alba]|uniref:protein FANTASTIC FOUR 3-like n=1 Tax=Neltuma alba TaxID=207710 RepID=UPI0010A5442C|nr:protein FANTASTIC FOUR 3-like [Prosopis alba]